MRVYHVLGYLAPKYGGPPVVALNVGKAMAARGAKVSWWATATLKEEEELVSQGVSARLFRPTFPQAWYRSRELYLALSREISHADIVHLHQVWDYPIAAAAYLARRHGKPYLLTPHGIFSQKWRYSSPKKLLYLQLIGRPLLNRAACIHAFTSSEADCFDRAGITAPATVIPNGIWAQEYNDWHYISDPQLGTYRWPVLQDQEVVLFLGRLSQEKGLDLLIHAWSKLASEYPKTILMLAGPDHQGYRAVVESLIDRLGLKGKVLLPGMLKGADKRWALSRASIYVQPSYTEGFSISVLEALASGKPCVVTQNCNFPEVAEAGAGKVVKPNSASLARGLSSLLSMSVEERQCMGLRGRQLVLDHYTWERVASQMLSVYQCILDGKPIPRHL